MLGTSKNSTSSSIDPGGIIVRTMFLFAVVNDLTHTQSIINLEKGRLLNLDNLLSLAREFLLSTYESTPVVLLGSCHRN